MRRCTSSAPSRANRSPTSASRSPRCRSSRCGCVRAGSEVFRGGIAVALLEAEPALLALHARVGEVLAGLGVALEARPYRPHVTLARKAGGSRSPALAPALAWRADGFALVLSRGGSYEVLAALGAGFT